MKMTYIGIGDLATQAANCVNSINMCHALASCGANVELVTPLIDDGSREERAFDYFYKYGVGPNFLVKELSASSFRDGNLLFGLKAAWLVRRSKPDVVYSRSVPGALFSALYGVPVFFESHAPIGSRRSISSKLFRLLLKNKNLKGIVVITNALRKYYVSNFPEIAHLVKVAPDAAVARLPEPMTLRSGGLRSEINVGYAGSLYEGKGVELILKIARNADWAHFHIVGGGEKQVRSWRNVARDVGNITFYGRVDHFEVGKYISCFDVALLPNQEVVRTHGSGVADIGQWTSPLKAFEYMAASKPIICSDLPVLREIFKDKWNALLCSPTDVDAWLEALRSLTVNPELRLRLGATAQSDFYKYYTWEARAKKILAFASKEAF